MRNTLQLQKYSLLVLFFIANNSWGIEYYCKAAEQIADLGLRVAVVEEHDASNVDVQFFKSVAMNRGSSIQFFDKVQDAKDWLRV